MLKDLVQVDIEERRVEQSLVELARWELRALHSKGGTENIMADLRKGIDVFQIRYKLDIEFVSQPEELAEARAKYGHLLNDLSRYPQHDLATFEYNALGEGSNGFSTIKEKLNGGQNLFTAEYFGGVAARAKYIHLLPQDYAQYVSRDYHVWRILSERQQMRDYILNLEEPK